jgi:hypothetical protein
MNTWYPRENSWWMRDEAYLYAVGIWLRLLLTLGLDCWRVGLSSCK